MDFDSLFVPLLCGAFMLALGVTFGSLGLLLVETIRAREAARRSAEPRGWRSLASPSRGPQAWYGGEHDGRAVGLRAIGIRTGEIGPNAQRWRIFLRVALALRISEPMGISVSRPPMRKDAGMDFDQAFTHEGATALSEESRAAMLHFVQTGYRRRRRRDYILGWGKGARHLHLLDRHAEAEGIMPADVLPDAAVLLVHNHAIPNLSPAALQALLDDMTIVARTIEADAGNGGGDRSDV